MSKTQTIESRSVFKTMFENVRIAFSALLRDEDVEEAKTLEAAPEDIKKAFKDAENTIEKMEKNYGSSSAKGGTTRKGRINVEHVEVKEQPSQKRVKTAELEMDER